MCVCMFQMLYVQCIIDTHVHVHLICGNHQDNSFSAISFHMSAMHIFVCVLIYIQMLERSIASSLKSHGMKRGHQCFKSCYIRLFKITKVFVKVRRDQEMMVFQYM